MRMKIINPVNLVNPVYFRRNLHVSLMRPERMKSAARGSGKLADCHVFPKDHIGGVEANCSLPYPFLRSEAAAEAARNDLSIQQ